MSAAHPTSMTRKNSSFMGNGPPMARGSSFIGNGAPHPMNRGSGSFMGFGKVAPDQRVKNIDKIKMKSAQPKVAGNSKLAKLTGGDGAQGAAYKPKVSQNFLQDWLDYPVDRHVHVILNSFTMWMVWLQWTNKGMAGLDPLDNTIRARVTNQLQVLGTAASLFLVIAVAGFLVPPMPKDEHDHYWVDAFGVLMFTASVSLILYIALALTAIYPLMESLRDDIAFDAFENYQRHLGGKETYLFFAGMQLVLVALLVGAKILYSDIAVYIMVFITLMILGFAQYLARLVFLSLDPISSMHLGLTNNPEEQQRAELLSHFILRKIPNTLIADGETGKEFFERKRESGKMEQTRSKSQKLATIPSVHISGHVHDGKDNVDDFDDDESVGFSNGHMGSIGSSSSAPAVMGSAALYHKGTAGGAEDDTVDTMTVMDLDGAVTPFGAPNAKPPLARLPTRASMVERARVEVASKFGSVSNTQSSFQSPGTSSQGPLPTLQDMFCHPDKYMFRSAGMGLVDSVSAYAYVTQVGCMTTEQFIAFLKESKQHRPCTCSRDNHSDAGTASHADQCSSRRAIVWSEALTGLGIPNYHAVQVIKALRPYL